MNSIVFVDECVCLEEDLADVQGGGISDGRAGPAGAHSVHGAEGPVGAGGAPDGDGSHKLMAVVELEQQFALDRLARWSARHA